MNEMAGGDQPPRVKHQRLVEFLKIHYLTYIRNAATKGTKGTPKVCRWREEGERRRSERPSGAGVSGRAARKVTLGAAWSTPSGGEVSVRLMESSEAAQEAPCERSERRSHSGVQPMRSRGSEKLASACVDQWSEERGGGSTLMVTSFVRDVC